MVELLSFPLQPTTTTTTAAATTLDLDETKEGLREEQTPRYGE